VSAFLAWIRSPCLRHCVHGGPIADGDRERAARGVPAQGGGDRGVPPAEHDDSVRNSELAEIYLRFGDRVRLILLRCRYDKNVGEEDVVIGAITVPLAIEGPEASLSLQDWYALTDRRKQQVSERHTHRERESARARVSGGGASEPFLSAEINASRRRAHRCTLSVHSLTRGAVLGGRVTRRVAGGAGARVAGVEPRPGERAGGGGAAAGDAGGRHAEGSGGRGGGAQEDGPLRQQRRVLPALAWRCAIDIYGAIYALAFDWMPWTVSQRLQETPGRGAAGRRGI
jgi:hypothetical protein